MKGGLKEVEKKQEVRFIEDKIYLYKGYSNFYKLHRIKVDKTNSKYALISLGNSDCWANGRLSLKEVQNKIETGELVEFSNIEEAIKKGFFKKYKN